MFNKRFIVLVHDTTDDRPFILEWDEATNTYKKIGQGFNLENTKSLVDIANWGEEHA